MSVFESTLFGVLLKGNHRKAEFHKEKASHPYNNPPTAQPQPPFSEQFDRRDRLASGLSKSNFPNFFSCKAWRSPKYFREHHPQGERKKSQSKPATKGLPTNPRVFGYTGLYGSYFPSLLLNEVEPTAKMGSKSQSKPKPPIKRLPEQCQSKTRPTAVSINRF